MSLTSTAFHFHAASATSTGEGSSHLGIAKPAATACQITSSSTAHASAGQDEAKKAPRRRASEPDAAPSTALLLQEAVRDEVVDRARHLHVVRLGHGIAGARHLLR